MNEDFKESRRINLVKLETPTHIGPKTTPKKPNSIHMKTEQDISKSTSVKKTAKENFGLFQKFILWVIKKNKGKIIASLIVAVRQIIYPFDVYQIDQKGNWVLDESKNPQKIGWASNVAKIGSLITFALAYFFNSPVEEFTGKGIIEWLQMLLN